MRNTRLELDCLMHMSKITNKTQKEDPKQSLDVLKDTFEVTFPFNVLTCKDSQITRR